jgi:excisionase family DNA binding protein
MAERRRGSQSGRGAQRSQPPMPLLTVPEVADRLRVSQETVRRYLRRGWLKGLVLGGRSTGYRIEEEELERFLAANRGATVLQVAEQRAQYDPGGAGLKPDPKSEAA